MQMLLHVAFPVLATFQAVPTVLQASDGLIEVTVLDSVTRAPIPGARITFIQYGNPPPNIVTYVNADANGQSVFKELKPANYGVNAQHPGYVQQNVQQNILRAIGPDIKKHQVEVLLTRGATVSGRVVDPNGIPVVEAQVTLATVSYRDGKRTMTQAVQSGIMQTDDRGEYRIVGVNPGEYYVQAELRSYSQFGWDGFWDNFPRVT
jgi:hypothetical protein